MSDDQLNAVLADSQQNLLKVNAVDKRRYDMLLKKIRYIYAPNFNVNYQTKTIIYLFVFTFTFTETLQRLCHPMLPTTLVKTTKPYF